MNELPIGMQSAIGNTPEPGTTGTASATPERPRLTNFDGDIHAFDEATGKWVLYEEWERRQRIATLEAEKAELEQAVKERDNRTANLIQSVAYRQSMSGEYRREWLAIADALRARQGENGSPGGAR
jgi:hypothetical protein